VPDGIAFDPAKVRLIFVAITLPNAHVLTRLF